MNDDESSGVWLFRGRQRQRKRQRRRRQLDGIPYIRTNIHRFCINWEGDLDPSVNVTNRVSYDESDAVPAVYNGAYTYDDVCPKRCVLCGLED